MTTDQNNLMIAVSMIADRINAFETTVTKDIADIKEQSIAAKSLATMALQTSHEAKADFRALQASNDVAGLTSEVEHLKAALSQLLQALAEDEDAKALGDGYSHDLDDGEHTLDQVKAAYLRIVGRDADPLTTAHIESADMLTLDGDEYQLTNTTHDRHWWISPAIVGEVLAAIRASETG